MFFFLISSENERIQRWLAYAHISGACIVRKTRSLTSRRTNQSFGSRHYHLVGMLFGSLPKDSHRKRLRSYICFSILFFFRYVLTIETFWMELLRILSTFHTNNSYTTRELTPILKMYRFEKKCGLFPTNSDFLQTTRVRD